MKHKIVISIISLTILLFVFFAICGVKTSVRHSAVRSALSHLPALIEGYKMDKGKYPASLDDLVTAESKPEDKNLIELILHDQWNDHYEYQLETNYISLKVKMPSGLFVKTEELENKFKVGDGFKSSESN
jgi:type II secretory pathway pseudopilin PulG